MNMEWQISTLSWNEIPRIDLHRDRREQRSQVYYRSRRHAGVIGLCAMLAIAALIPATVNYVNMRIATSTIQKQTLSLGSQATMVSDQASALQSKAQAYRQFKADSQCRHAWPALLFAIAASAPKGVYLSTVSVDSSSQQISIEGTAGSVALIDAFVSQMQNSPVFSDTALTGTDLDTDNGVGFRFTISSNAGVNLSTGD